MDNHKIILVFYVGAINCTSQDLINAGDTIRTQVKEKLSAGENFLFFILPDYEKNFPFIKLECINPQIINEESYKSILDKLNKIEENIKIN